MNDDEETFAQWLEKEMTARRLTRPALCKRSGLQPTVLYKALKQLNNRPSPETCRALARALGISEVIVFQKAGLLSTKLEIPTLSPLAAEINQIVDLLSPSGQEELLELAQVKLKHDRQKN